MNDRLEDFSLSRTIKPKKTLQKVGIVGCGAMGQEISILISQSGIEVAFIDISQERIDEVFERMNRLLDERINKWGLTNNEKKLILSRIKGSTDYNAISDSDIVLETVNTKKKGTSLELRQQIFRNIEEVVSEETVIASNTATLMISEIASVLKHPERAIGLHFFGSVNRVKIIEMVRSVFTNDKTVELIQKFTMMIGRKLIHVNESSGNVSTRMLVPIINEACEILMEGVATVSDVDEIMKETAGLMKGPFEMADSIGLDKVLKWMENLYAEFGDQKYKPSPIIKRLVRANMMGRRTGEGFYKYTDGKKDVKGGSIHKLGRE
ncbi:MAG: 3-hydroxyacyl-CoA dehydrogenase family protein [Bacteroidales bacterium]|jgi:3-hydroxybutyryl-CoA dehydrogenase|nr:3-hydroxyacyl-CoA dehydrogenase family protein [Bacteroidales bacterium]